MVMFPPALNKSTIGVRQYKRYSKRRRRKKKLGATASKHALRMSPIRQSSSTPELKSSSRSILSSTSQSDAPQPTGPSGHRTRAEARARLFSMKRRIVGRLLQKQAGLMGGAQQRNDCRLLIMAYKEMDEDGSGSIDYDEFVAAVGTDGLDVGLAPDEIDDLFVALDVDGSGDVSVSEFLSELMVADKPPAELMIDRGRRMTLDAMERKVHANQERVKMQQIKEETNNLQVQEEQGYPQKRAGTARSGRRTKREWEHPLQTQRPSTSNSEYGSHLSARSHTRSTFSSPTNSSRRTARTARTSIRTSRSSRVSTKTKTDPTSLPTSKSNSTFGNAQPHSKAPTNAIEFNSNKHVDTERRLELTREEQRNILGTPARKALASRKFGGKSFDCSPKFLENKQTWNKVGYGSGVALNTHLYHSEPARRSPLRIAPMFPRADDRRGSVQLKKALAFQRREKGNHNVFAPGRSAWENNNGFVPLKIKQDLKDGCEYRVTKSMRKRDAKTENQEYNRVAGKTKQQLIYSQCQMESQGYLNRQRGIGTGVGGLRSEARRINMGGVQAAHIIRGTETPWLG